MTHDSRPGLWPPAATFGLTVGLLLAFVFSQAFGALIAQYGHGIHRDFLTVMPWAVFWFTATATPTVLVLIWLLTRGRIPGGTAAYLSLKLPRLSTLLLHLVLFAVYMVGLGMLVHHLNDGEINTWMLDVYREPDGRFAMAFAVAFLAPLQEECLFRGFFYRGIAGTEKPLQALTAIVVGALIFTALHVQYNPVELIQIFGMGVAFGLSRWHSKTLWTPFILHVANNSFSLWIGHLYIQSTTG